MPFDTRRLTLLSYWEGRTLWHCRAGRDVTLDVACAPGYLDDASGTVRAGDTIWVTAAEGARTLTVIEAGASLVTGVLKIAVVEGRDGSVGIGVLG